MQTTSLGTGPELSRNAAPRAPPQTYGAGIHTENSELTLSTDVDEVLSKICASNRISPFLSPSPCLPVLLSGTV